MDLKKKIKNKIMNLKIGIFLMGFCHQWPSILKLLRLSPHYLMTEVKIAQV